MYLNGARSDTYYYVNDIKDIMLSEINLTWNKKQKQKNHSTVWFTYKN